LVNRAWARLRDFRLWSFHVIADSQLFVPAVISAGTVTVTFGSTAVTADATAAAALNAASTPPPIASTTLGIGRQIKVGSSATGVSAVSGANYTLTAWDGVNTLTLDRPYGEQSQTNTNYQILKCYYAPPALPATSISPLNYDSAFVRYLTVTNRESGYTIRGRKLYYTQQQLNSIDPQRGAQGDAYIIANYSRNSLGQPVIELYPNPVTFTTYAATYVTRWADLSATVDLPQMPYELSSALLNLAKVFGAHWALANTGTYQELQQVNWVAYAEMLKQEFRESLIQCLKLDDEIMPWQAIQQSGVYDFPLGGQFLQSHDVSSLIT
jgi:hypothetical protein